MVMEDQYNSGQDYRNFETEPQRPLFLAVLCVLSFVNAGFQILVNLVMFLSYDMMKELVNDENWLEMMEKMVGNIDEVMDAMQMQLSISRVSYLITALLFAGSFTGVLYMWKLQKKGFHFYAVSQILILIVTVIFVTSVTGASIWGSVIQTVVWIMLYYMYYKRSMQ